MIPVYLRLTPQHQSQQAEQSCWAATVNETTLEHHEKLYPFRRVLENASQQDVYKTCAAPLVDEFLAGQQTCFFALGATGSGKTYTVVGTPEAPGVIRQTVTEIFARQFFDLKVCLFELYNDRFYDLLDESSAPAKPQIQLRANSEGFTIDAVRKQGSDPSSVLAIIERGFTRRAVHATNCNDKSSRSHAFLLLESNGGSMLIADMAGSERLNDAKSVGAQRIEAGEINKSLMNLGQALQQLLSGQTPSRTSKLARILLHPGLCKPPTLLVTLDPFRNEMAGVQILRYASTAIQIPSKVLPANRSRPTNLASPTRGGATCGMASPQTQTMKLNHSYGLTAEARIRIDMYEKMDARLAALSENLFAS